MRRRHVGPGASSYSLLQENLDQQDPTPSGRSPPMLPRPWLNFLRSRLAKGKQTRRQVKDLRRGFLRMLELEVLEDRTLLATVNWINPTGGDWSTTSDWSTGSLPTALDDVVIPALGGGASVTHSTGSDSVHSISSGGNIILSGGTLSVSGDLQESAGQFVSLQGGTLAGCDTHERVGTAVDRQRRHTGGCDRGVRRDGGRHPGHQRLDRVRQRHRGLTLNGTATLGGTGTSGYLQFSDGQTLGGGGTVVFAGTGPYDSVGLSSGTLTIGAGITVRGQSGYVGYTPVLGGSPSNIVVVNQGTIQWAEGGSISIQGTLTNSGTLTVDSTSSLATGGTIVGGTIVTQAGAQIYGSTLDGVTIDGDFRVVAGNGLTVKDGLTLNGTATLGDAAGSTYGYLLFNGTQTLGGNATVVFGGHIYNTLMANAAAMTLTIGAGVTVRGKSGYVGYSPYLGAPPRPQS